jgi:hypothetical protein
MSEQETGEHKQKRPGDDQLRQTDLDQHATEQRQHRTTLGARGIVLNVTAARRQTLPAALNALLLV